MAAQVIVIGGGIVGVCSALFLQREGLSVTLIEAGNIGEGTSFGNAGNISPGAVVPYLVPGILREAPKWLFDPEGPLKIRPGYFFKALPWFLAAANESKVENALRTSRAMRRRNLSASRYSDSRRRNSCVSALGAPVFTEMPLDARQTPHCSSAP